MNCEKIKQKVEIRTVLEYFGIFPFKENRNTAFYFALDREEKVPSLSVDFVKNKAFDFGNGKSYDVISIVQEIKKCSVSEALEYLSTLDFSFQNEFDYKEVQTKIDYQIINIKEIKHPALVQYLKSRCLYLYYFYHLKILLQKNILIMRNHIVFYLVYLSILIQFD